MAEGFLFSHETAQLLGTAGGPSRQRGAVHACFIIPMQPDYGLHKYKLRLTELKTSAVKRGYWLQATNGRGWQKTAMLGGASGYHTWPSISQPTASTTFLGSSGSMRFPRGT
jgi:hypothetical protein